MLLPKAGPLPRDWASPRVLVVEDEALIALEVEFVLERHGFVVIGPAANVADALRLLQEGAPDAAILDVNLGGEQVFPVADALAAQELPFVFTTGYDAAVLPPRHRGRPVRIKPCRAEELVRQLTSILSIAS